MNGGYLLIVAKFLPITTERSQKVKTFDSQIVSLFIARNHLLLLLDSKQRYNRDNFYYVRHSAGSSSAYQKTAQNTEQPSARHYCKILTVHLKINNELSLGYSVHR